MNGKYSPEVSQFMAIFNQVKELCDDEPEDLVRMAAGDPEFTDLCIKLYFGSDELRMAERSGPELFAVPVNSAFPASWREYEERYETFISSVWLHELLGDWSSSGVHENSSTSSLDDQWIQADEDAVVQAEAIEGAIRSAEFKMGSEYLQSVDIDLASEIQNAAVTWTGIKTEVGFDLRGVFRRRALIPFVLVPQAVAARHDKGTLSLLTHLKEAHHAFVFGSPLAALALMRSIMEATLRDHYGASGRNLNDRIESAKGRLPTGASVEALHQLRQRANSILHLNGDNSRPDQPPEDPRRIERDLILHLLVLRALIEGAPG